MTAHEHRAHATLAPSSAHRWLACPGSIRMSSGVVDAGSVFAAEGTAAHELAEMCIKGAFPASRFAGETIHVGEQKFVVTPEMVEAVQIYLDVAEQLRDESDEFESEQRMDMTALVPGVFGTGDIIAYSEATQKVTIADLKYGKGVAVEVEENEQLLTYAMGVAERYHNRGISEVELIIVQPRAPHPNGPVRRWSTDVVALYEHVAALQSAAVAVEDPHAPLVVGDHCKFCKAAGFCGALETKVKQIMGLEQPEAKPMQDWQVEQSELNLVGQWLKGRETFLHAQAVAGNPPPGAKLVPKRAFRKWVDEEKAGRELVAAGADLDDLYEPPKLKSPAVIEKLLPKAKKPLLKDLAKAESSGAVLAPLSDPRPAVDASAANGFEAMETGE
ncbi:hypothetical protein ABIE87_006510 [Bradyrhizobium diazoefficiens]|uniref:DUF2800 domain-containing protein n=1 Tax=Bradyrhizobium diazoefficiens TaxID=1355477 RepID=UPI003515DCA1